MNKFIVFKEDLRCDETLLARAGERVHISGEDSFNYYLDLPDVDDLLCYGVKKHQCGSLYKIINKR